MLEKKTSDMLPFKKLYLTLKHAPPPLEIIVQKIKPGVVGKNELAPIGNRMFSTLKKK